MTTKPFSSSFVWFDYVAPDVSKALAFYGELFRWKSQELPMGPSTYTILRVDDQGIGGMIKAQPATQPGHWICHLSTLDARASAEKVVALGGSILEPVTKVGDFGSKAIVADALGGVFTLWQPARPGEHTGDYTDAPHHPCWNELYTNDTAKSVAFYRELGGFSEKSMEMKEGTYHVLESGGKSRGGIMKAPMPMPQAWMPYIQVASCDESIARAKGLGANVHIAGEDVPGVGRLGVFSDPLGGMIGVLQPARS